MHYFVGWDVGGWNCKKNPKSRDALAVLHVKEGALALCGSVYRGNIREGINSHGSLAPLVNGYCKTEIAAQDSITLAIDTPLGMPQAVYALLTGGTLPASLSADYSENPYLYRQTEFWLFQKGFSPLSAIKDMIGSQSTKGMHLISKLGLTTPKGECGIWSAGGVTAIETYPTPSMTSARVKTLYAGLNLPPLTHEDRIHAVFCALVAYLFATDRSSLPAPEAGTPKSEGWIWIPADAVAK